MGTTASLMSEVPERLSYEEIVELARRIGQDPRIDQIRFNVLKDSSGTVSRSEALQLVENKFPPIFSLNALYC
jgi:hypothetical protein